MLFTILSYKTVNQGSRLFPRDVTMTTYIWFIGYRLQPFEFGSRYNVNCFNIHTYYLFIINSNGMNPVKISIVLPTFVGLFNLLN